MKRGFKSLTASFMASLILASAVSPVLAQNYNYIKPAQKKPTTNYNYGGYSAPAQNNYQQQYNNQGGYNLPPLQGRVTTVPTGAVINGVAPTTTIDTQYITAGDSIVFTLNQPYYYNGAEVLPAGTSIQGNAVIAQSAGFTGKYGRLKIMFNNANLPNGQRVPISGKLLTQDGTGILSGGTTSGRAISATKNAAGGAAIGALSGLIGAAISGGKKGKGAALGTAIGGGLGLGKSMISKGNEVYIEAGQPVDIILDQPLTVGGNSQYGY